MELHLLDLGAKGTLGFVGFWLGFGCGGGGIFDLVLFFGGLFCFV